MIINRYRDGGTIELAYKGKTYYLDKRARSKTKNSWYTKYPTDPEAELITDFDLNLKLFYTLYQIEPK